MSKMFTLWRFIFSFSLAKSGTWANITKNDTEVSYFFSLNYQKHPDHGIRVIQLIILCFEFSIGYVL